MSRCQPGDRVGAILKIEDGAVHFIGYGIYDGDQECEALQGLDNPHITLDDGKEVWGHECWWGPEAVITERTEGLTFVSVDIDEYREYVALLSEVQVPAITINGTSRADLLEPLIGVTNSLRDARRDLPLAMPHRRDYRSEAHLRVAREQHAERQQRLASLIEEFEDLMGRIVDAEEE